MPQTIKAKFQVTATVTFTREVEIFYDGEIDTDEDTREDDDYESAVESLEEQLKIHRYDSPSESPGSFLG